MKKNNYENTAEKKGNVISSQFHRVARIGSKIGEENVIIIGESGKEELLKNPKESYIKSVDVLSDLVEGIKDGKYYEEIKKLSKDYNNRRKKINSKEGIRKLRLDLKRKQFKRIVSLISRIEGTDYGMMDEN